jgi:two-component system NtrC family sensor kinase
MGKPSLKWKISLYLSVTLALVIFLFASLMIRNQREELFGQAVSHANQLAEVVIKSTRFAMLQNQPSHIDQIIQDVAEQGDIDRVRVISKDGTIIHSSVAAEVGQTINEEAESCEKCHVSVRSCDVQVMDERARFFRGSGGRQMLGNTRVIQNEPSCYNAACHAHDPSQTVLGVLDIISPLDRLTENLRKSSYTMASYSAGFLLAAALVVGFLVHRVVYLPLRELEEGARALSAGKLDRPLPVRSDDELGRVTRAFNDMTQALNTSQGKLEEWARTLEEKVEEKTRELQLAQADAVRGEKLASIGMLAAGIAHELNNPLTGVLTFATLVRQGMDDDLPEAEDLDLVIKETKRCATIIRRLLDFAREKAPEKNYCDLNKLIRDAAQLIEQPARLSQIEVVLDLGEDLPVIWIDEDLVKQVIMNMLVNAQHAIGEGGRITLKTAVCPEPMALTPGTEPVEMVEVTVTDTGCGISESDLAKIFDPFFTTKEVGKGTGLGLSVSHGAVLAHGGDIRVESQLGVGTTFRIFLPVGTEGKA